MKTSRFGRGKGAFFTAAAILMILVLIGIVVCLVGGFGGKRHMSRASEARYTIDLARMKTR